MRLLRLLAAAAAVVWIGAGALPALAGTNPAVDSITTPNRACAGIGFELMMENPVAGTITLRLTGHTPGSSTFVPLTPDVTVTISIVPGQTTYDGTFGPVSQSQIAGFNTLRVEIASTTIAGLDGTTTKSASFDCTATTPTPTPTATPTPTPSGTPTPTPPGTPTPTPTPSGSPIPTPTPTSSPTSTPAPTSSGSGGGSGSGSGGGTTSTAALALTGGFDYRFLIGGLAVLVAGLILFVLPRARRRSVGQT